MNTLHDLFEMMKTYLGNVIEKTLNVVESVFLFSSEQIPFVMVFVFVLLYLALFVVASQRFMRTKPLLLMGACLAIPLAVLVMRVSFESMRGGPDDRCHKYEDGNLTLSVVGVHKLRHDKYDLFSGEWVLLLVRSARWGNEPHLCRVDTETRAGKVLLNTFFRKNEKGDDEAIDLFGEGEVTFRFGRPNEEPNVTFKPTAQPDKKIAPAEPPREKVF